MKLFRSVVEISSSWNFLAQASQSYEGSEPRQAELGHFNFRAETELTKEAIFLTLIKNVIQIFQFCACTIMITTNSYQFYDHLYISM
jgi:hypothetical protein